MLNLSGKHMFLAQRLLFMHRGVSNAKTSSFFERRKRRDGY